MLRPTARLLSESLDVPIRCSLLPGHGPAPWGLELKSYEAVVESLARRLFPDGDASGQLLAGYSLGGRLALGVALGSLIGCEIVKKLVTRARRGRG